MTLKHVLKFFSKKSEDLGAKGSFAIAQDDGKFSSEGYKELPSPVAFATQSPKCRKTRHFDKMLKQVQHDNFSCAEHTERDLPSNRLNDFKKAAFTLAEVLITLAIIGVVAAMTLPTLIQNHQKQTYVTGLKKAYANLQNAFGKMAYDEGVTDWNQTYCASIYYLSLSERDNTMYEECFNRFKKQFNVVKSGTFFGDLMLLTCDQTYYEFYTSDGMRYANEGGFVGGPIFVDVNGDKGPNKPGRDRFVFGVDYTKSRIIPAGINNYQTYCTTANVNSNSRDAMDYCTAKVLIEGKMDY